MDSLIRQHRGFSFGCFPHVLLLLCFVFCARLFVKLFLVHATHVGDRSHSISSAWPAVVHMGRAVDQSFFWRMCPRNSIVQNSSNLYPSHFCKRILQHVPSHSFLSFPQHTTFLPFLYMSIIVYHPPRDSNHGQNRPISTMFLPNFAKAQVGKTPELPPGHCPDPFPGARVARCRGPCHVRSRGACPEACPGACRATWAEAPREH